MRTAGGAVLLLAGALAGARPAGAAGVAASSARLERIRRGDG